MACGATSARVCKIVRDAVADVRRNIGGPCATTDVEAVARLVQLGPDGIELLRTEIDAPEPEVRRLAEHTLSALGDHLSCHLRDSAACIALTARTREHEHRSLQGRWRGQTIRYEPGRVSGGIWIAGRMIAEAPVDLTIDGATGTYCERGECRPLRVASRRGARWELAIDLPPSQSRIATYIHDRVMLYPDATCGGCGVPFRRRDVP